jgi:hypothetical protein
MVLFRCSTGEDWQLFMYHYSEHGNVMFGRFYFLFYTLLSSFVMLNMFTLVVTQQFEDFYFNPDNPITTFVDMSEVFRKQWNFFTWKTKGRKIKERSLVDFFSFLRAPLGYKYVPDDDEGEDLDVNTRNIQTIVPRQEIARQIWKMDLPVDSQGNVPFGAVLHAAMKNAYGKKFLIDIEKDAYKIIKRIEMSCLGAIINKTTNETALNRANSEVGDNQNSANPFLLL